MNKTRFLVEWTFNDNSSYDRCDFNVRVLAADRLQWFLDFLGQDQRNKDIEVWRIGPRVNLEQETEEIPQVAKVRRRFRVAENV